jgi:orotidine-5'-phosphate decarboxylase
MSLSARDRLIVALDVPNVAAAERAVGELGDTVTFFKVGYELAFGGGLEFAADLARSGKQLFLDLKLHDIANTVARATERVAALGATFLTVHAYVPTMRAAVEGRANSGLKLLAVTVLTSWNDADLKEAGHVAGVRDLALHRARQARALGVDGLIASPMEAADLRRAVGAAMLIVTPGVRPTGSDAGDQKRVMTPAAAIRAGADYLVVGRPVLAAVNRRAAAQAIVAEIESAAGY